MWCIVAMARESTEVCTTVGSEAGITDQSASVSGLRLASRGQTDIGPTGEAILEVPRALPVPEEHQGVCHGGDGSHPIRRHEATFQAIPPYGLSVTPSTLLAHQATPTSSRTTNGIKTTWSARISSAKAIRIEASAGSIKPWSSSTRSRYRSTASPGNGRVDRAPPEEV